jgi:membrane-bound ClpP family serine protease
MVRPTPADSAGLFVAQAAELVAMAPDTTIGSGHPRQVIRFCLARRRAEEQAAPSRVKA